MDQADSCRRAAAEAVADVDPPRLSERLEAVLDGASMLPGVVTLESAAAIASETTAGLDPKFDHDQDSAIDTDAGSAPSVDDHLSEGVLSHAAGVQLIYEGLRLTRSLAHEEPWTDSDEAADEADLAILAADILVARGFYLLARTDAADKAVRTVQAFGRDQTRRNTIDRDHAPDREDGPDPTEIDANLERDTLELAVLAGAAAVGDRPTVRLLAIADDIADDTGTSFPPASDCLSRFESPPDRSIDDGTTDRATSATDP